MKNAGMGEEAIARSKGNTTRYSQKKEQISHLTIAGGDGGGAWSAAASGVATGGVATGSGVPGGETVAGDDMA